jgi:hypothetical protein
VQHVSTLATRNGRLITDCIGEVKGYLVEGIMTEQFVTDNINALIDCARRCNVALRWRMLHRRTSNRKFYDLIVVRDSKLHNITLHMYSNRTGRSSWGWLAAADEWHEPRRDHDAAAPGRHSTTLSLIPYIGKTFSLW